MIWVAALKMANVEVELLTDLDMLLMTESGIRVGVCHSVLPHPKSDDKLMKGYDENIILVEVY